jgi:uncharacterized protein (TIGR03083 family)
VGRSATRYFWLRRAAHELTVHLWDAANATGADLAIAEDVATDGIDEFLGEFGERAALSFAGDGETVSFVAEPSGMSYTVTLRPEMLVYQGHATPDAVVRAPAARLLLFLWGRTRAEDLSIEGAAEVVARWHERVRI